MTERQIILLAIMVAALAGAAWNGYRLIRERRRPPRIVVRRREVSMPDARPRPSRLEGRIHLPLDALKDYRGKKEE